MGGNRSRCRYEVVWTISAAIIKSVSYFNIIEIAITIVITTAIIELGFSILIKRRAT